MGTSFGAGSKQVDNVQVRPKVTHDLQLWHQCLLLTASGSSCNMDRWNNITQNKNCFKKKYKRREWSGQIPALVNPQQRRIPGWYLESCCQSMLTILRQIEQLAELVWQLLKWWTLSGFYTKGWFTCPMWLLKRLSCGSMERWPYGGNLCGKSRCELKVTPHCTVHWMWIKIIAHVKIFYLTGHLF